MFISFQKILSRFALFCATLLVVQFLDNLVLQNYRILRLFGNSRVTGALPTLETSKRIPLECAGSIPLSEWYLSPLPYSPIGEGGFNSEQLNSRPVSRGSGDEQQFHHGKFTLSCNMRLTEPSKRLRITHRNLNHLIAPGCVELGRNRTTLRGACCAPKNCSLRQLL